MSGNNGVIRVGRKGRKKFAFGEDGEPFEVDVVVAYQAWICIDEQFREEATDRIIPTVRMPEYHRAAVEFAQQCVASGAPNGAQPESLEEITTAEALDFIARLREQWDEVVTFFRPKLREERDSPDSSGVEHRFSEEPAN